jgi:Cu/Ag efflux pump CusA
MRLPRQWRENPELLKQTYVDTLSGQRIPLERVADIREATGPNMILRENSRRRFVVSINPTTEDLNAVVERLQRELKEKVNLPKGYSIALEGEYLAQREATSAILYASTILLIIVIFLLHGHYRSFPLVFLTLGIIPISLVGAVLYTKYSLDNVSIATLVGFIAVSGIAARNNIMLLTHYLHLMRHEGEGFTRKMVERGTMERLAPILMTALSAGIALVPILMAIDEPGREILGPVSTAIVGGLITSTLLGLAVTPALFYAFCRKPVESILAKDLNPDT